MMINLVLFGPPGSGKGTQAAKLVKKYGLTHISTGDLFRYEIGHNTPLGIKAKQFMDDGILVPDDVTMGMLENRLDQDPNPKGYIFDGVPRTVNQAKILDDILRKRKMSVSKLIALTVTDDEIVKRLLERGKTSGRPDDRNEDVIRKRIEEYNAKTAPVFEYYARQKKEFKVNGIGSIDDIFKRLCNVIEA